MLQIHLSDNLLFFSKLLALDIISSFPTFSDNGGILWENFQNIQQLPGCMLREVRARSQDRISIFILVSIFMLSGDNEIFLKLIYFIKRSQDYHSFYFRGNKQWRDWESSPLGSRRSVLVICKNLGKRFNLWITWKMKWVKQMISTATSRFNILWPYLSKCPLYHIF